MAAGSRHALHLVPEVTYGTTPTSPGFLAVRHNKCGLGMDRDSLKSEELRSDRQISGFRLGQKSVGGPIEMEISNDAQLETMLEALLGGTWNTNVLKAGTTRRSFSMMRTFDDMAAANDKYLLAKGVELASAEFKINPKNLAMVTFDTVAQSQTFSDTAPAGATFGSPSTTLQMDSFTGTISEGGSGIAVVTELSLKIDNKVDRRFVIGSTDTILPDQGQIDITGSITAYFESDVLLNKFINDTQSSLQFVLSDGSNTLTIELPAIKYTGGKPDVSNDKSITLTLPFQAIYDSGSSSNIVVTRSA